MLGRLAIFEFRMYFIPGVFGIISFGLISKIGFGYDLVNLSSAGDLTQSFLLVFSSYILGQFLQSVAHGTVLLGVAFSPEQRLKNAFWDGCYPSELMLFPGSRLINQISRQRILERLGNQNVLNASDIQNLSGAVCKPGQTAAQSAFFYLLAKYSEKETSGVKTAESYYHMLKGLSIVSAVAFLITSASSAYWALSLTPFAASWPQTAHMRVGYILPLIFFLLWRVFRYRCRGAGEGFARQVFLSALLDP